MQNPQFKSATVPTKTSTKHRAKAAAEPTFVKKIKTSDKFDEACTVISTSRAQELQLTTTGR
jgi:hypothetical protein